MGARKRYDHEVIGQLVADRPDDQPLWDRCREVAGIVGCSAKLAYYASRPMGRCSVNWKTALNRTLFFRLKERRRELKKLRHRAAVCTEEIKIIKAELKERGIHCPRPGEEDSWVDL